MPRAQPVSTSALRRHKRANFLLLVSVLAMRPCSSCTSFGVPCAVSPLDERCEQCVRHNRHCELASPWVKAERVLKKKEDLDRQILESEAKTLRLRKQKRLLQKKLRELGDREEQNIQDLERDEAAASALESPAPAVTSPTGLSQVSFDSFGRTTPVPSGS
jgi:TolA-binding protein